MQRLVVSSTRAIRTSLERRLEILQAPQTQLSLFPQYVDEEWSDLDGQEQFEILLKSRLTAMKSEKDEVKLLLRAAKRCEEAVTDAKAEALLEWIYQLQAEEGDSELKFLIFTEFVPTQEMLSNFLADRGFSVEKLNGSMNMDARIKAQEKFSKDARILVSTDAGGEGLNLQFCHVVINYDIPWNPMRLEQRIGRVDRIGQEHTVRAINFVFEDSVEYRVREVLEEKLAIIYDEFGIDKTGDVLDSAQAGKIFDNLFIESILNPEKIESSVDDFVDKMKDEVTSIRENASIMGETKVLDPKEAQRIINHPLPHWIERMSIAYLNSNNGKAIKEKDGWNMEWPSGEEMRNIVFTRKDAENNPESKYLSFENKKIYDVIKALPHFAPGQPVPVIYLPGVMKEIKGIWSLWRISVFSENWDRYRIIPLFMDDDGTVLQPTARHIWDQFMTNNPEILDHTNHKISKDMFKKNMESAQKYGQPIYEEMLKGHQSQITREREKRENLFAARRRMIERIGLPEVRKFRLKNLEKDKQQWLADLKKMNSITPEIQSLIILRLEGK